MVALVVFADFNCPFCYALDLRLEAMDGAAELEWEPIEHTAMVRWGACSPDEHAELAAEVFTVRHRAPEVPIRLPRARPRTGPANRLYAAVRGKDPAVAMRLRRAIYSALWEEGQDIGDPKVLASIAEEVGCGQPAPQPEDLHRLKTSQKTWEDGPFDRRLPAAWRTDGATLLGLSSPSDINRFVTGQSSVGGGSGVCVFVPRPVVLVVGSPSTAWDLLAEFTHSCDLRVAASMVEATDQLADVPPDLVIGLLSDDIPDLAHLVGRAVEHCGGDTPVLVIDRLWTAERARHAVRCGVDEVLDGRLSSDLLAHRLRDRLAVRRTLARLRRLVRVDALTGVPGRREFDRVLGLEWQRARRSKLPLSVLMIDIDNFKAFNDQHGHLAGDACLRGVARALSDGARRASDQLFRFGGEEFVAVLPDSDKDAASTVAARCLELVRSLGIEHGGVPAQEHVSVSIGSATLLPSLGGEPATLLDRADRALFEAKGAGRNRLAIG
jgi:diguanylate cyclase (GGDEF)-like protein